jgi:putative Holliday junction resolvase
MGLDVGEKKIGVALSDELGWTAQGLEVIERCGDKQDAARLKEIAAQYGVREIVVGLPKNMDGTIGFRGEYCKEFAEMLKQKLNMTVHLWDERLTTVAAEKTLLEADVSRKKRKKIVDKIAAVFILQSYLDAKGGPSNG